MVPRKQCSTTQENSFIGKRVNDFHGEHFPCLPILLKKDVKYVSLILNVYQLRSTEEPAQKYQLIHANLFFYEELRRKKNQGCLHLSTESGLIH